MVKGEHTTTRDAIGMRLSVVLVQATVVLEKLVALFTIVMLVIAVFQQVVVVVKVRVARTAESVSGALDPVLSKTFVRVKVLVAVVTVVMPRRV